MRLAGKDCHYLPQRRALNATSKYQAGPGKRGLQPAAGTSAHSSLQGWKGRGRGSQESSREELDCLRTKLAGMRVWTLLLEGLLGQGMLPSAPTMNAPAILIITVGSGVHPGSTTQSSGHQLGGMGT